MRLLFLAMMLISTKAMAISPDINETPISSDIGACDFPKNDLWYPEAMEDRTSKAGFSEAIQKVQRAYEATVAAKGARLQINNMWSDGTVNAQAYREGSLWEVDMFGGLARYGRMDKYAVAAVACHEVGHHLGGRPRYNYNTDWASVEGQADRWAALGCVHRVYPGHELAAFLTLARTLASLGGETEPHLNTPDPTRVWVVTEGHPPAQCRLDTMYDAYQKKGRPGCWYPGGI